VDEVFAQYTGSYLTLLETRRRVGDHPAITEQILEAVATMHRINLEKQRLRRLLDACPQPRRGAKRN
jgi:hypothetical protein